MTTIETVRRRAEADAKTYGYYLHPDPDFLNDLLDGLQRNEERYGYPSCPCRLASGKFEFDRDIICPCDYRDPDVAEFGACYCALYVRRDLYEGKTPIQPVRERRPLEKQARAYGIRPEATPQKTDQTKTTAVLVTEAPPKVKLRLWYCRQCGYVVFREDPPYVCPVCKAKREMFAELHISLNVQT